MKRTAAFFFALLLTVSINAQDHGHGAGVTPDAALAELKAGNQRFLEGKPVNTNYPDQIEATKGGQQPHSFVLGCMDSRVPTEIIFDQGIGNIFTARVAGNIEDENMLGSIEYAVEHAGTKLVVVLGHSHCGAVAGAVKGVEGGNLTQLLGQIKPAIVKEGTDEETIAATVKKNVELTIQDILNKSAVVKEMVDAGDIKIVGAHYDIETGKVVFY